MAQVSAPQTDGYAPPGQVWHFSEDPHIHQFVPHQAATSVHDGAFVWACSPDRCPDYWFPRQCPRGLVWRLPDGDDAVAASLLGRGRDRLHVIEHESVADMATASIFAYPFDADRFTELEGFAMVSREAETPLGPPIALASPWQLHAHAGIDVMVTTNLISWWHNVIEHAEASPGAFGFSGIRLRNSPNYTAG